MKIIITGSEGLIGKQLVKYFTESGHLVIKCDYKLGHDLYDEEVVEKFFNENKADALINCFAYNPKMPDSHTFLDLPLEEFNEYLFINLTALFSVCRQFIKNNKTGSIVNFSSIYGVCSPHNDIYGGKEKNIAYGISKAGVIQLTKHLAIHSNCRVNCVVPSGVYNNHDEDFTCTYCNLVPLGRMMEVGEICGIVEFLISDKASYCTGGIYPIDGGYTAL